MPPNWRSPSTYSLLKIFTWRELIFTDQLPTNPKKHHSSVHSAAVTTRNTMTLAINDTSPQSTFIPPKVVQKTQSPPPVSVSAIVTNCKEEKVTCDLRVGSRVQIFSKRENRTKYNGMVGEVCAVVWPRDISRSIIYVKVAGMQPCFFYSELTAVAPQAAEEVQSCQ